MFFQGKRLFFEWDLHTLELATFPLACPCGLREGSESVIGKIVIYLIDRVFSLYIEESSSFVLVAQGHPVRK